jgi:hypothetical protein
MVKQTIYGIFEKETGELLFIGRTEMSLDRRWRFYENSIYAAKTPIQKYIHEKGPDKFEIESLKVCTSDIEGFDWEHHLILECEPKLNRQTRAGKNQTNQTHV